MRNLKTILPMLAFVLAIGMSFAFVNEDETIAEGYYGPAGNRTKITVNCDEGNHDCRIQFVDQSGDPIGLPLLVYPDQSSMTPLPSLSEDPFEIEQ